MGKSNHGLGCSRPNVNCEEPDSRQAHSATAVWRVPSNPFPHVRRSIVIGVEINRALAAIDRITRGRGSGCTTGLAFSTNAVDDLVFGRQIESYLNFRGAMTLRAHRFLYCRNDAERQGRLHRTRAFTPRRGLRAKLNLDSTWAHSSRPVLAPVMPGVRRHISH